MQCVCSTDSVPCGFCTCCVQVELYDKAGDAIPGAEAVEPSEVTGAGTIYNPALLTLSLRHAWVVAGCMQGCCAMCLLPRPCSMPWCLDLP